MTAPPAPRRPGLVPTRFHRPAAASALAAAAVVGGLAVRYQHTDRPGALDLRIMTWVDGVASGHPALFRFVVTVGGPGPVLGLAVVVAAVACWFGYRRLGLLCVVAPALTGVVTTAVKPLVGRLIGHDDLSFPSGHTAAVSSVGLVLAVLVLDVTGSRRWTAPRVLTALGVVLGCTAVMALAVVGAGMHYPTDAVGGAASATAVVITTALLVGPVADRTRWLLPPARRRSASGWGTRGEHPARRAGGPTLAAQPPGAGG